MSDLPYNPEDFVPDARPSDVITLEPGTRRAVIRTSDSLQFLACRRRWGWQSHLRNNLGAKETASPLWFGSGIHFALEDFHGANVYGHPAQAFKAYSIASSRNYRAQALPYDLEDLDVLGHGMMSYYADNWLRNRDPLKTFVFRGVPQVEVNAHLEIPYRQLPSAVKEWYDQVIYSVTLDRVVEDEYGHLYIMEYKTAKRMEIQHFPTDPQVGRYIWIGNLIYGRPIHGVIYMQFRKAVPSPPKILANGKLSLDKRAPTTHSLFRAAVVKLCGPDFKRWPAEYTNHVNWLANEESSVHDNFIRRDRIERNEHAGQAEGVKVLMMLEDMLNPNLPLYPNPTRFQCHFCPFQNACISLDDGGDYEDDLKEFSQPKPERHDTWRKYLPSPQQLLDPKPQLTQF